MLIVPFKPLKHSEEDASIWTEYCAMKNLVSCLAPDFASLLHKGKIDHEAITACHSYLNQLNCLSRDRTARNWSYQLYFGALFAFMFQGRPRQMQELFDWLVPTVVSVVHELTQFNSPLQQFILRVDRVRSSHRNFNTEEHKIVGWHNFRTDQMPHNGSVHKWYAFRVELILDVIKHWEAPENWITLSELRECVAGSTWAVYGNARFYDIANNAWPMVKTCFEPACGAIEKLPLQENELLEGQEAKFPALFIQQDKYHELLDSANKELRLIDYKKIMVQSASYNEGEPYNFYEALCYDDWFGFRAVDSTPFAPFATQNRLFVGSDEHPMLLNDDIVQLSIDEGFDDLNILYSLPFLNDFFTESFKPLDEIPTALLKCPFQYRDDEIYSDIYFDEDPWLKEYYEKGMGKVHKRSRASPIREDDEQSSCLGGSTQDSENRGSIANVHSSTEESPNRVAKVARKDSDEDSFEVMAPVSHKKCPTLRTHTQCFLGGSLHSRNLR